MNIQKDFFKVLGIIVLVIGTSTIYNIFNPIEQIVINEIVEEGIPRNEIHSMISDYVNKSLADGVIFGANATLPIAGATYNLSGSGITGSATSITLQSFTIPQTGQKITDADVSETFYITLDPGNRTRQEISACTTVTQNSGGDATLSGCDRGISPITPFTASTTLQFSHSGGAQVIFSDPPSLFNEFTANKNVEVIERIWTFDVYPVASSSIGNPTTTLQLTPKQYVDAQVNQGAATSTESVGGIVELATQLEMASGTPLIADQPLVIQTQYSTSSPGTVLGHYNIISNIKSKLVQIWLDLTEAFTWTGKHIFQETVTFNAHVTSTDSFTQVNSTSTNSVDAVNYCVNGTNCITSLQPTVNASSTGYNASTTIQTTAVDFLNHTIPASELTDGSVIEAFIGAKKLDASNIASTQIIVNGANFGVGCSGNVANEIFEQTLKLIINSGGVQTGRITSNANCINTDDSIAVSANVTSTSGWETDGITIQLQGLVDNPSSNQLEVYNVYVLHYAR